MDQAIRNKLRSVVTQCRRLLEESVAQQLQGRYDIYAGGKKEEIRAEKDVPLGHLTDEEREARHDILAHFEHITALGYKPKEALDQLIREIAFTHLNRLCAYKMMEVRDVYVGGQRFREAVSKGLKSQGFLFYLADHPEDERRYNAGDQELAYRHFLNWLGGTLSQEIGVLFSPTDPANRVYPPQRVLDEVLDLINSEELNGIWTEDETIGWVYQYFTPKELRDQARKESQAPRNSYELAFRNQFFTPRYVVEFLTDNTLGQTWYEMRKGNTRLKDECRYMVRRLTEIFLEPRMDTDAYGSGNSKSDIRVDPCSSVANPPELSHDELLRQPAYIPHRPKKDPREIKILDPACGSGHFLLYCFALLLVIYEEAYEDPDLGPRLHADYPTKDDLRRAIPGLVLRHNPHGIDIDLRCTQIAALALWLRCQRAYQEMGLKKDRPPILKANVVCAEPMPGEGGLLDEFLKTLREDRLEALIRQVMNVPKDQRVRATRGMVESLSDLVRTVWDKMRLAGEAGSLLKIEEDLQEAIRKGQNEWEERLPLFRFTEYGLSEEPKERLVRFVPGVVEGGRVTFWDKAETPVRRALDEFVTFASNGGRFQRQLFVEDAEQGLGFVDVCRRQFDVLLMNPPFGAGSLGSKKYVDNSYPTSKSDLYASFVERGVQLLDDKGLLGAITSRTAFFLKTFQKWREDVVLGSTSPSVFADLGASVLDSAMVETAAYCLDKAGMGSSSLFIKLTHIEDKAPRIELNPFVNTSNLFCCNTKRFFSIPNTPFAYWTPKSVLAVFSYMKRFCEHGYESLTGASTKHNARFLRLKWEVKAETIGSSVEDTRRGRGWVFTTRGGRFSRYYTDLDSVIDWFNDGESAKTFTSEYYASKGWGYRWNAALNGHHRYFQAGLTWPLRGQTISVRLVARGVIPGFAGKMAYASEGDMLWMASLMNSCVFDSLVRLFAGKVGGVQYEAGLIQQIPLPPVSEDDRRHLGELVMKSWRLKRSLDTWQENSQEFILPRLLQFEGDSLRKRFLASLERERLIGSELAAFQAEVDDRCFSLYGISESDRLALTEGLDSLASPAVDELKSDRLADSDDESDDRYDSVTNEAIATAELVSWAAGVSFARFDVRLAVDKTKVIEPLDPFTARSSCSPGMLVTYDGIPMKQLPEDYLLSIGVNGILVDGPDHLDDIIRRVREVLEVIWKDRSDAIEKEACETLSVSNLRDYFRKPGVGGFWDDHISRYSKSRRKAPIYWLLQSSKKNYALWVYYHRLDKDILFKALLNYVEPKLRKEEARLGELRSQKAALGSAAKGAKKLDKDIERQGAFLSELRDFEDKLRRAANLHLDPDLNDGVVLNIAPFREVVPWKEAKSYWDDLMDGQYEWSSIAKQLREKGLVFAPAT